MGLVIATAAAAPVEESFLTDPVRANCMGPSCRARSAKCLPNDCQLVAGTCQLFGRSWQGGGCGLLRFSVDHLPRLWGISVTADQQAAGAVMKVLGGAYLWTLIAIRFFRWSAAQRRTDEQERRARFAAEQLTTADVEAALAKAGPPPIEP